MLLSLRRRLVVGALIPVLALFFISAAEYSLAYRCDRDRQYDDVEIERECMHQEVAVAGFIIASPVFAALGAALAAMTHVLTIRLARGSSGRA